MNTSPRNEVLEQCLLTRFYTAQGLFASTILLASALKRAGAESGRIRLMPKAEVAKSGDQNFAARNGLQVSGVWWGVWCVILCWMLVVGSHAMGQTGDLVIDSFQYATPAAAQAAWVCQTASPADAGQLVLPGTIDGVSCLTFPCSFTGSSARGYWDKIVSLNLSAYTHLTFRINGSAATHGFGNITIYFLTGSGGWWGCSVPNSDQWQTVVLPLADFQAEGTCNGWSDIRRIRISPWKLMPGSGSLAFSDLRAKVSTSANMLLNSGFEITTSEAIPDYWGPGGGFGAAVDQWVLDMYSWRARWGVDRTISHSGSSSLRIVGTIPLPLELKATTAQTHLPTGASTFSVWLRSDQPNLPVTLQVYGCSPSAATNLTTPETPNTWQRYSLLVSPTNSSTNVYCSVYPTGNGTLWVDDVQLETGTAATPWQPALDDAGIAQTAHKVVNPIADQTITPGGSSVTVGIDSGGRFLVDGQPFIPMAMGWQGLPSPAVLQHLAQAGFNTIVPNLKSSNAISDIRAFLDSAKANGLKVIFWADTSVPVDTLGSWITSLKDHPAIIMWYVYDEPVTSTDWQDANTKYTLAKTNDPSRPAMVNSTYVPTYFYGASDLLSMDYYGISNISIPGSIGVFWNLLSELNQMAVTAGKPTWCWLQTVGNACFFSREPTGAEAECLAYLALIHGSRGIMYFYQQPRTLEQWNELRLLNYEVDTLTPVLSSMDTPPIVSSTSPSIHLLSKSYGGRNYVIAVNELPLSVTADLMTSDAGPVSATVLFENRNVSVTQGKITDTFAGYQRHVYSYEAPAAYWRLDETSGSVASDSSGNGHNGTVVNATWTTSGRIGGALSFTGTNAYVVADNVAVNTTLGGFNTVAFWMKWDGSTSIMPFGWNAYYDLFFSYNGFFGINTGEEGNVLGISSAGLAGQWVHVAVVFPNGVPSAMNSWIYINGVAQTVTQRVGSTTQSRTATPEVFLSGWGHGSYWFAGALDDVRIYNRALTADEVAALAAAP